MKLYMPLIAMAIGALMFTGFYNIFMSVAENNNIPIDTSAYYTQGGDTSLEQGFLRLNQSKSEMDSVTTDFYNQTITDSGSVFGFLSLTYNIAKLVGQNIFLIKDVAMIGSAIIGIDPAIVATLITILFVVFTISALYVLMGRVD